MNLNEFFYDDPAEKSLEHLAVDGGYCGILRSVACVGDSLDSGEIEIFDAQDKRYCIDKFEYSWLSYFGRVTGNEVRHFTRGGMSAMEYVETFANGHGLWDRKLACNAYVVTLACNDISQMLCGEVEFGTWDDIDFQDYHNNKKTFMGYYATILQRYREISPRCRIFLVLSLMKLEEERLPYFRKIQTFLQELSQKMRFVYFMDLYQNGPVVDEAFTKKFFMNGHMTPAGYLLKGRIFTSYMDYIIRHNLDDFTQIATIGEDLFDPKYTW
ncbi:MAG: SGNH/GDSL hydrolase family protein [Lentisphaeria bacterium]|nr:SGNH/GDSL hydrolase family protein [Lentisphaeria bacterium]